MPFYPADRPEMAYGKHHAQTGSGREGHQLRRVIQKCIGSSQPTLDELAYRVQTECGYMGLSLPMWGEVVSELDRLVGCGKVERTRFCRYRIPSHRLRQVLASEWLA